MESVIRLTSVDDSILELSANVSLHISCAGETLPISKINAIIKIVQLNLFKIKSSQEQNCLLQIFSLNIKSPPFTLH